jgi:hypothetical protein
MPRGTALLVALACLLGTVSFVASQATKYSKGDHVPLFANKVHLNFPTCGMLLADHRSFVSNYLSSRGKSGTSHLASKPFAPPNVPLFTLRAPLVTQVGPFANPSEQYEYYTLPFCAPKDEVRKSQHLGEVLAGDRMMETLYKLPFLGIPQAQHRLDLYFPDMLMGCGWDGLGHRVV